MDVLAEAVPTEVPPTSSVLVSGLLKALHELDWSARRAISREKTKSTMKTKSTNACVWLATQRRCRRSRETCSNATQKKGESEVEGSSTPQAASRRRKEHPENPRKPLQVASI